MTLLPVLMIVRSMARVEWTVNSIPVPLTDPEGCNLDKPGWLCDPDFWYTRDECNALADLLGPVDRVPPMALLLLKPDNDQDSFGNLQYASCDLKNVWISSINETVKYPYPEMQLNLIKGIHFRVCPAGFEDLSVTARILDSRFEVLRRQLKQYMPELTTVIEEVREDLEVVRQWYHLEGALFSVIAVGAGLVSIFYQQMKRYMQKGSSVILPWSV